MSDNGAAAAAPSTAVADARSFGLDRIRPAVLTIDLHRGHLDPAIATLPLPADRAARVVRANVDFLAKARSLGVPVVHMVTRYRTNEEIFSNPFWKGIAGSSASRGAMANHNLDGRPGTGLMPGVLHAERDLVLDTKKRYDCFLATELDFVLRNLGANLLFLTGVNTNSCVLSTAIAASTRDYAPVVVRECVDSMDGEGPHDAALALIRMAFAWVMSADEASAVMAQAQSDRT